MKKMKKILWGAGLSLVLLIIIAAIVVGLCLGGIVKSGINRYGPAITQTPLTVDSVSLSLLTGSATIKGLVVGNPPGYQTPQAISIGEISVGINPATVLSDKVVIRHLKVDSAAITFEGGFSGNNLTAIKNNVNGTAAKGGPVATNSAARPAASRKLEVDDLDITNAKVSGSLRLFAGKEISISNLPIPEIHLTGLGTGPEGITATDLTQRVLSALTDAVLQALEKDAGNLTKGAGNLGKQGLNGIKSGLGNLFGK